MEGEITIKLNITEVKKDAFESHRLCSERGLLHSSKWAAELCFALDEKPTADLYTSPQLTQEDLQDYDRYIMAKSYFDLKEYDRAAHFLEKSTSPKAYFLYIYSRYMSGEKKRQDDAVESLGDSDSGNIEYLKVLRVELSRKHKAAELDGYALYLYGVVLKKLELLREAVDVFVESVCRAPLLWSAWHELALLLTDKDMLASLPLPDHWMKHFFLALAYLEFQQNEEALQIYYALADCGMGKSSYVRAQTALAYNNLTEVDLAVQEFENLQKMDPFRLENLDTFSNLLYVKVMRKELANLAHSCCDIDKYRVETCCVIGNFYSLRSQHEKAVLYFQRALKLNPNYLSAWTLVGHEYIELKNTSAAIQAYRHAIEANRKDYRAWYGLGQTYELLKMPLYCLYYYNRAQMLRPNDSRMIMAMGSMYEKLERLQEAKKCYWKAYYLGDREGLARIRLAKLYERLGEDEHAAGAYAEYIVEAECNGPYAGDDLSSAYKYLANYQLKQNNLDEAYAAAQKCTQFFETREEGKALLRQISQLRALGGESGPSTEHDVTSQQYSDQVQTPKPHLRPMSLTFTP